MKNKPEDIFNLSQETAKSLSTGAWEDFLRTAAWNFKYDFTSQLLIYAQKPSATACASYDVWTSGSFQRMPRKGTSIALFNDSGERLGIRYVFDISDTFVKKGANPSNPVWSVTLEKERAVREALAQEYLPYEQNTDLHLSSSARDFYNSVAFSIVREQYTDALKAILSVQNSCALAEFSELEVEDTLRALLSESLSAILQYRCGLTPDVRPDILALARYFDSIDSISILGSSLQDMSRQALLEVAHTVKQWDNEHKEEFQHENHISAGRGTSDPESEHAAATETEQVRPDAQNLSEGSETPPLRQSSDERQPESASVRSWGEGSDADREYDAEAGTNTEGSRNGYALQHSAAQQFPASSGRADTDGSDLLINEDDISRAITAGPPLEGGKYRLYAAVRGEEGQRPREALPDVLREEYGTGSRSFMLSSGLSGTLSWGDFGLRIERGELRESNIVTLTWEDSADRLRDLIAAENYLDASEKVHMDDYFSAREAFRERRRTGAALEAFLSIHLSEQDKASFNSYREQIRAYVLENSDTARQALLGKLLELNALDRVQSDPDAQAILEELSRALSFRVEDENTLPSATDAGYVNLFQEPLPEAPSQESVSEERVNDLPSSTNELEPGMVLNLPNASYLVSEITDSHVLLSDIETPLFSQTMLRSTLDTILQNVNRTSASKANSLNSSEPDRSVLNSSDVKGFNVTARAASNHTPDYSEHSIHSLRTAIGGVLSAQYDAFLSSLDEASRNASADIDEFALILEDFINESAIYASEDIPEQIERALRTPDYNGSAIAATALQMRESENHSISRAGEQALLLLQALYQIGEAALIRAAQHFGWTEPLSPSEPANPSQTEERAGETPLTFGHLDIVSLRTGDYEVHFTDSPDIIELVSLETGEVLPPITVRELQGLLDANAVHREDPTQHRDVRNISEPEIDHPELHRRDLSRLERSDKVVLSDLLYHYATYRATFDSCAPELNARDALRREEQLSQLDGFLVSDSVEENLENLRITKSVLNRWFLSFEGIRPDILDKQQQLISAAEQVLSNPPKQDISIEENKDLNSEQTHTGTHTHTHTGTYIDSAPLETASSEEEQDATLWDFEVPERKPFAPGAPVQALPLVDASGRINHRTGDMAPHFGGPKERFRNNVAAIRLLKELERDGRLATAEEQEVLSKYVGWGGIQEAFDETAVNWRGEYLELQELLSEDEYAAARASTLTAFYTPPVVIDAIYKGLSQLGIESGNILDAGCGTGAFFGQAPEQAKLYGVEIDIISGRIAQQLYQQANVAIEGFEETKLPNNFFNAMVGNVPFGNTKVFDPQYNKYNFELHDYFFAKGLDKVRPGGVLALVTSAGTMDKKGETFRRYLAEKADLIGAIRLPNNTFRENAGTDVTSDILFLRKREKPRVDVPDWVVSEPVAVGQHYINRYFAENREMVLGRLEEVSGPFGSRLTCSPIQGQDLGEALQGALSRIYDDAKPILDELDDPAADARISIPADPDIPNYSFAMVGDEVYYREDSEMFRVDAGKKATERIKDMIELRDIVRRLISAQVEDRTDTEIHRLQSILNELYDAFVKKHGRINSRGNELAFSDDNSYYLLCSLEQFDKQGNFAGKADIFTKRTISAHKTPDHADTPYEALLISIGERGRVDLNYMEQLSGISREDLLQELDGQIFEDPVSPGVYLLAASYLSGNIRNKLHQAHTANERDPGRFENNIRALEGAIPEPLGPDEISVRLGATWVPPDVIRDFMYEKFKTNQFNREHRIIDVEYSPLVGVWAIKNKGYEQNSFAASSTYGTKMIDAYTILENTLNLRDVRIYKPSDDDPEKRIIDVQETIIAQEKQDLIRSEFESWIWSDPDRTKRLCEIYNERFNSFKPPEYDGNILTFHGMSPTEELRKNQKEVVARILFSGNTQIAAAVGAGKTWMMTAAAMEGKYLGHCSKSMIVVPNHLVGQWATEIYDLYPAANVLAVTKKDFEPKNRRKFCSRIATGDYDIVVIGHSQLEKIPLSVERQKRFIEDQIDEIVEGIRIMKEEKNQHFTVKQAEAKKRDLQRTLKKLSESKRKDNVITFEELGVDRLFIDESDEFKNLYLQTKMQNVAGLAQTDAQKAYDLFLKCRYMDELTGGRGNIHATGTPLSNTMAEIYTWQRFLQYDTLKELGLHHFDSWLSSFGEVKPVLELAPEGTGYRMRNRLTNFYNVPELMSIYRQVAEIQTHEMLDIPLPKAHYITKSLPASEYQESMIQEFAARAEAIRNGAVKPEEDNMLCVVNDGRKVALDQRLLDSSLPDDPNSKVNAAAESIYELWLSGQEKKLTQLVFCDISTPKPGVFNVYDALRDKLVEMGIPREEIRFIHEANSDAQKDALFSQVRDGTVRVLMGSTGKMGTGTNVQDLLVGNHHLDCPWRPRDLTQRDGRAVRFGNTNDDVYIVRYVKEGTFDAYMYQLLESKQRLVAQVFTSKNPARTLEDIDQMTLSFAEIKGIASGSPLIKEKVELQLEISKLEMLRARHYREQNECSQLVNHTLPAQIKSEKSLKERLTSDVKLLSKSAARTEEGKYIPITVEGGSFDSSTKSGDALLEALNALPPDGTPRVIAHYRGFNIVGTKTYNGKKTTASLTVQGACSYPLPLSDSGRGIVQGLNYLMDTTIPQRADDCVSTIAKLERRFSEAKSELGKPFLRETELREKSSRMKELDEQLNLDLNRSKGKIEAPEHNVPSSLGDRIHNAEERAAAACIHTPGSSARTHSHQRC